MGQTPQKIICRKKLKDNIIKMENSLDLKETDHFIKMGRGMFKYLREQGGRSCTGARVAAAEKFGLGRNS